MIAQSRIPLWLALVGLLAFRSTDARALQPPVASDCSPRTPCDGHQPSGPYCFDTYVSNQAGSGGAHGCFQSMPACEACQSYMQQNIGRRGNSGYARPCVASSGSGGKAGGGGAGGFDLASLQKLIEAQEAARTARLQASQSKAFAALDAGGGDDFARSEKTAGLLKKFSTPDPCALTEEDAKAAGLPPCVIDPNKLKDPERVGAAPAPLPTPTPTPRSCDALREQLLRDYKALRQQDKANDLERRELARAEREKENARIAMIKASVSFFFHGAVDVYQDRLESIDKAIDRLNLERSTADKLYMTRTSRHLTELIAERENEFNSIERSKSYGAAVGGLNASNSVELYEANRRNMTLILGEYSAGSDRLSEIEREVLEDKRQEEREELGQGVKEGGLDVTMTLGLKGATRMANSMGNVGAAEFFSSHLEMGLPIDAARFLIDYGAATGQMIDAITTTNKESADLGKSAQAYAALKAEIERTMGALKGQGCHLCGTSPNGDITGPCVDTPQEESLLSRDSGPSNTSAPPDVDGSPGIAPAPPVPVVRNGSAHNVNTSVDTWKRGGDPSGDPDGN